MKKLVTGIILGTALVSGSAMASKARLIALGEDASGSFFVEDNRDFFLNIAHIHEHGNQMFFETGASSHDKGTVGAASDTTVAGNDGRVDLDEAPVHEGGFVSVNGNTAYGIVLGHEVDAVSERRFLAAAETLGSTDLYVAQDNVVDLFFGKDQGNMKWAAGLQFSETRDQTDTTAGTGTPSQTVIGGRLGVVKGSMSYYANFGLVNKSRNKSGTFEGNHGVEIGAIKKMGAKTAYLAVQSTDFETTANASSTLAKSFTTMKVKAYLGNEKKVNDKVSLFTKAGLVYDKIEVEKESAGSFNAIAGGERTRITVPVSVAIEAKVKSWLSLRGSIAQNLYGTEENGNDKVKSLANSTDVNAGMGFHFGDLTIDGLIGTGNAGNNTLAGTDSEAGVLSTDNLMTRLSMTYKF